MEIIDIDTLIQVSKDLTIAALNKDLIPTNKDNIQETAHNIAEFYYSISNYLSEHNEFINS